MPTIWENLVLISVAALCLAGIQAPLGFLVLRWLGWPLRWSLAVPIGALLLALGWFLGGSIGATGNVWRSVIALGMMATFYIIGRKTKACDQSHAPLFHGRLLIGLSAFTAISTLIILVLHGVIGGKAQYFIHLGDYYKHLSVTRALTLSDAIPASNPFLSTAEHLRYYLFFYLPPATLSTWTGIAHEHALFGQTLLIAVTWPFFVYEIAQRLGLAPRGAMFAAFLLTAVGGLDSMYLFHDLVRTGYPNHIDSWVLHAERRINAPHTMLFWTPQHMLGVMAFMLLVPLYARLHGENALSGWKTGVFTTLILAGLAGTSAYAWFGTLLALLVLGVLLIVRRAWLRATGLFFATLFSFVLALPFILTIAGRGGNPILLEISPTRGDIFHGGVVSQFLGESQLTYALDFPFQMSLEFGAIMVLGLLGWWQWRKTEDKRIWWQWTLMLVILMFVVLAIRSDDYRSNNFAARVAPLAWVLLAYWGAWWWQNRQIALPRWLRVLLVLGVISVSAEPVIQTYPTYIHLSGLQLHFYATSQVSRNEGPVYEWLNTTTPEDSVFQFGFDNYAAGFLANRWAGYAEEYHSGLFATEDERQRAEIAVTQGYTLPDPAQAAQSFASIGIDYVVVTVSGRLDATLACEDAPDFAAHFELVFANDHYRVYAVLGL